MNIAITTFLNFEGNEADVEPILNEFSDIIVGLGFGNSMIPEDTVMSVISVKSLMDQENVTEYLEKELDESFFVIIPVEDGNE